MIAKKRMDKNEPIIGWQRKQHLEEVSAGSVEHQKRTSINTRRSNSKRSAGHEGSDRD